MGRRQRAACRARTSAATPGQRADSATGACCWSPTDSGTVRRPPSPRPRRSACFERTSGAPRPDIAGPTARRAARHARRGHCGRAHSTAAADKIVFGGIGNIAGMVVRMTGVARMVSLSGTAGHNARKIQAFDYPLHGRRRGPALGRYRTSGMSLHRYPGLCAAHPTLIAAVLYRDFARRRDDATVLVARGADAREDLAHRHDGRSKSEADVVAVRQRARRAGRAARLRAAGPDAHRHRRVGDRAQRLQLCAAAAGSSSAGRRTCAPAVPDPRQRSGARASPTSSGARGPRIGRGGGRAWRPSARAACWTVSRCKRSADGARSSRWRTICRARRAVKPDALADLAALAQARTHSDPLAAAARAESRAAAEPRRAAAAPGRERTAQSRAGGHQPRRRRALCRARRAGRAVAPGERAEDPLPVAI